MVGRITSLVKKGLVDVLVAFATRDSAKLIHAYQTLDILLPGADLGLLDQVNRRAFDLFWGKNMSELKNISPDQIQDVLYDFRELLYDMPFQVPHDLIFLARAIGLLSGLCTGLDPDFNVWEQIVPYARKLISGNKGDFFQGNLPGEFSDRLSEIGVILQKIRSLPSLTYSVLEKLENGNLEFREPKLEDGINRLVLSEQKIGASVIFAAFMLSSVDFFLGDNLLLAFIFGMLSLFTLAWICLFSRR
jgi:predicted unusual protein kinase regulating ubiquinone biosynthesis (AarF/ABC1/UbiB family)